MLMMCIGSRDASGPSIDVRESEEDMDRLSEGSCRWEADPWADCAPRPPPSPPAAPVSPPLPAPALAPAPAAESPAVLPGPPPPLAAAAAFSARRLSSWALEWQSTLQDACGREGEGEKQTRA